MRCQSCGRECGENDNFCSCCGQNLKVKITPHKTDEYGSNVAFCSCCGTYYNKDEYLYCPRCKRM